MNKILAILFLGALLEVPYANGHHNQSHVNQTEPELNESRNRESEARNKAAVLNVIQEFFGQHNFDVLDLYIREGAENYIQHNPRLPDGREAVKDLARKWFEGVEKEEVYVPRISAENDLVWVHYRLNNFGGEKVAAVAIFRFDNDKIVEHWDVIQPIGDPKEAANDHPLF